MTAALWLSGVRKLNYVNSGISARIADQSAGTYSGPGTQIGGAAKGLAEIAARTLGHVVDEDDRELVAAARGAQKAEQGRDI